MLTGHAVLTACTRRTGIAVSVLVPARDEEDTLPMTLPTILRAATVLREWTAVDLVEVVVIVPASAPVHALPPVSDPMLRWVRTSELGKFSALCAGAATAHGDVLVLVDADVVVEPEAFVHLLRPLATRSADIVAGRIGILPQAWTTTQRLLERWASISVRAWDLFRRDRPEFLWALPGAIYAIRRQFFPNELLVPLVDDASIGLQAMERKAVFAYAPDAVVRTPAPATYLHWTRQKFRSRRGWARLALIRPVETAAIEGAFRGYLAAASTQEPTSWLMRTHDRLYRIAARMSLAVRPSASGAWKPGRSTDASVTMEPRPASRNGGVLR